MNGKHYIGKRVSHIEKYDETAPISGVALLLDENNQILAGDQNGFVLDIECPYGTQAMANDILAKVRGHTYKGFRADNAPLDIGAELGDGVTVDGLYSVLAYRSVNFGPGHFSEIAAPGENELRHEYNYLTPNEKLQRKIAGTNSRITKTAEQIRLEVNNEVEGLNSSIQLTADNLTTLINNTKTGLSSEIKQTASSLTTKITAVDGRVSTVTQTVNGLSTNVSGLNGKYSTLQQKVDSFTLTVSNGSTSSTIKLMAGSAEIASREIKFSGLVSFTDLSTAGKTTINGGNIKTGTIEARYLNLEGAISFGDLTQDLNNDIASAKSNANIAVRDARNIAAGIFHSKDPNAQTFIDGTSIYSPNLYSPNIHTNNLYIYADNEEGGFYLIGKYNNRSYSMLAIDYQIGEVPYVNIYSPARAFIDIGNEYANIAFYGNVDFSAADVTGL